MNDKEIKFPLNASIEIEALLKGFKITISKEMEGDKVIAQIPGMIALIDKLAASGFTPTSGIVYQASQEKAPDKEESHLCPVHNVEMKKYQKGNQTWYSHSVDGGWCTGKAKK
jgi:hypothetical protein